MYAFIIDPHTAVVARVNANHRGPLAGHDDHEARWQPCVPQVEPFHSFYLALDEGGKQRYDAMSLRQRAMWMGV